MPYIFHKVCLYLIFLFPLNACDRDNELSSLPLSLSGFTMGTSYNVKIIQEDKNIDPDSLQSGIDKILLAINQQMSTYIESSELSKINKSTSTDWIEISEELYEVINIAQNISFKSGGAFDITIGPIVNLWGFGPDKEPANIPEYETIKKLLDSTGYQHLHLQNFPHAIRKDIVDIYIDLSGIAKGYAVDRVAAYLEQHELSNYMVEIGGEIRASGVNDSGTPWQIGIEKPVFGQRIVQEIINLDNLSMGTSGGYRNFFEIDGKYYSHTINPETGMPIEHDLASVTVFYKTAMHADALATALLVLGPDRGLALAEQENLPALFIIQNEDSFSEIKTEALTQLQKHK